MPSAQLRVGHAAIVHVTDQDGNKLMDESVISLLLSHNKNPILTPCDSHMQGTREQLELVGLSVWRNGGLLGCGSENNQLFVYDLRSAEPIWVHGFEPVSRAGCENGFVSSVCWRQVGDKSCALVAGDQMEFCRFLWAKGSQI